MHGDMYELDHESPQMGHGNDSCIYFLADGGCNSRGGSFSIQDLKEKVEAAQKAASAGNQWVCSHERERAAGRELAAHLYSAYGS